MQKETVNTITKSCILPQIAVITKSNGQDALSLLRERQEEGTDQFDLVLSDVYMPDMDGFKLLEAIGLELDLPVIMMSSNGDTNVVLRGVTHGAVDFLIKPVRIEELRNVWQHVVRRRSLHLSRTGEDSAADFDGDSRTHGTKRKESEMIRAEHEGGSGNKKARVVWSVEMHQQFVNAVNILGIDKAVPKRILDLMNVEGLTRENVASHLQKYRLYLKRVEGVHAGQSGKVPKPPAVERAAAAAAAVGMEGSDMGGSNHTGSLQPPGAQHTQHTMITAPMSIGTSSQPHMNSVQGLTVVPVMSPAHVAAWQQQTMAMQAAAAASNGGVVPSPMPPYMYAVPTSNGNVQHAGGGHYSGSAMPSGYHHHQHQHQHHHQGTSDVGMPRMPPVSSVPSFASHGSLASSLHHVQHNNNGNGGNGGKGRANDANLHVSSNGVAVGSNGNGFINAGSVHPSSHAVFHDSPSPCSPPEHFADEALLPNLEHGGDGLSEGTLGESLLPDLPAMKHHHDHYHENDFLGMFIEGMESHGHGPH